jgi:hypothetical protein
MKIKDNSLFEFLDYIFKVKNTYPKNYKVPTFLVNRWISMANPAFARIVNSTTNRWCTVMRDFDLTVFYRNIFPEYKGKTNYIKKEALEKEDGTELELASHLECSKREINLFNQTLAELNITNK